MELKLSERQAQQIESNAVQAVVQKQIAKLIEKRAAEIEAELEAAGEAMSAQDIADKYLPQNRVATPEKAILVPANS